jgi:cell division protein FtsZ
MKIMIMGIGDAIAHILNQTRMNQNEVYKNNIKYSFISTSTMAITNTLGKIFFQKEQITEYYEGIDYLDIGRNITKGLGANGNTEKALKAFNESEKEIDEFLNKELKGIEFVIVVAALGGGTGTAITPLINKKIKDMNIPLINIITLPFEWEGTKRNTIAIQYISEFYKTADKVFEINNIAILNKSEKIIGKKISIKQALKISDRECAKKIKLIYERILIR